MSRPQLLTVADSVALLVNAISDDRDHTPVLKLFTPDGAATWLISEADPDDPDRLFGLCDLGLGSPELGYVSRAELTALRGPLGLPVERDAYFVADNRCGARPPRWCYGEKTLLHFISPSTLSWPCHVPSSKEAYGQSRKRCLSQGALKVGPAKVTDWAQNPKDLGTD